MFFFHMRLETRPKLRCWWKIDRFFRAFLAVFFLSKSYTFWFPETFRDPLHRLAANKMIVCSRFQSRVSVILPAVVFFFSISCFPPTPKLSVSFCLDSRFACDEIWLFGKMVLLFVVLCHRKVRLRLGPLELVSSLFAMAEEFAKFKRFEYRNLSANNPNHLFPRRRCRSLWKWCIVEAPPGQAQTRTWLWPQFCTESMHFKAGLNWALHGKVAVIAVVTPGVAARRCCSIAKWTYRLGCRNNSYGKLWQAMRWCVVRDGGPRKLEPVQWLSHFELQIGNGWGKASPNPFAAGYTRSRELSREPLASCADNLATVS